MAERIPRRSMIAAMAATPVAGRPGLARITRAGDSLVDPRKVRLWENTRKEFREAIESGRLKAVIIPTASTEQHNEHLAMIFDTAACTLVAEQIALAVYPQALVATPVAVGISPHWMDRKGTLSLRKETFLDVVFDIAESLQVHGVKTIWILNGHGGNAAPLKEATPGFREKLGINIQFNSYWDAYTPEIIKKHMESNRAPGHAAEFETSVAMAAFPERIHWEGVDYERAKREIQFRTTEAAAQDAQFFKEAKLASTVKGEQMLKIAVDWGANRLREMIAAG